MMREDAELSIEELSKSTKIQEKYLLRLENNDFEKLPSPVYIRGFIKKWAGACNENADEIILQFERENQDLLEKGAETDTKISQPSFIITSKHIILTVVLLSGIALAVFFYFNQKLVSEIPQVEVLNPVDFSSVTEEDSVFIQGEVQNAEKIFIDGQEVEPQKGGNFEVRVPLSAGLNTITIKAISPAGKEVETARKILKL